MKAFDEFNNNELLGIVSLDIEILAGETHVSLHPGIRVAEVDDWATFNALVTPEGEYRFEWDFGDGVVISDGGAEAGHFYEKDGRYQVTVRLYARSGELLTSTTGSARIGDWEAVEQTDEGLEEEQVEIEKQQAFDIKDVKPIQFTVSGEFIVPGYDDEAYKDCPPRKSRFSFSMWNVGALAGDDYAAVNAAGTDYAGFVMMGTERCEAVDYILPINSYCREVEFSGGPDGVLACRGLTIGKFMDGKTFVIVLPKELKLKAPSPSEFPLADPSVFSVWK